MAGVIVVDASVVIAHFSVRDAHSQQAFEILDTEEDLGIHPLNLAETLVRPAQSGEEGAVRQRIAAIGIEQLVPSADEPVVLARLRAETGLRMPDCCVLAAARQADAGIATFDARLAAAARARGLSVVGAVPYKQSRSSAAIAGLGTESSPPIA